MVDTNSQLHGTETPYTHEKRGHEDTSYRHADIRNNLRLIK